MEVIGVVGAGTMGGGIAQVAAQNGHPAMLCDVEREFAERGLDKIRGALARRVVGPILHLLDQVSKVATILHEIGAVPMQPAADQENHLASV